MSRKDDLNKLGGWGSQSPRRRPTYETAQVHKPEPEPEPEPRRQPEPGRQQFRSSTKPPRRRLAREQGGMDRAESGPRKKLLSVTLTDAEREAVRKKATQEGLTCSSWARRVLVSAARGRS